MQADSQIVRTFRKIGLLLLTLGIQSGQVKNNLHMALDSYNLFLILNF